MSIKIGENIQALRKEKHLTQEELAEVFGVTSQSISKWELGLSCPDISVLPEIADYFKVSIDELIGYKPMTSISSLYLNIKSLVDEKESFNEKIKTIYQIAMLASTCVSKNEKDSVKALIEGKKFKNVTLCQNHSGTIIKGNNSLFMTSFDNYPVFDTNIIRKVHRYLTSINKMNTLKVLFALHNLMIENGMTKNYTMNELVEKTNICANDIWIAFNDLNVEVVKNENGEDTWQLTEFYEVPMLVTLIIKETIDIPC